MCVSKPYSVDNDMPFSATKTQRNKYWKKDDFYDDKISFRAHFTTHQFTSILQVKNWWNWQDSILSKCSSKRDDDDEEFFQRDLIALNHSSSDIFTNENPHGMELKQKIHPIGMGWLCWSK